MYNLHLKGDKYMQIRWLRQKMINWDSAIYFLLVLPVVFILYEAWSPGFLFTLDSQFTPNYNISNLDLSFDTLVIKYLLYAVSRVVDPELVQIIYWSACLYIPSTLAYSIAKRYMSRFSALVCAFFLILNPFVYQRLVAGHIHLILTLGLLIPYIHYMVSKHPGRNWKILFLTLLGTIVSPHFFWYLVLINGCNIILGVKFKKLDFRPIIPLSVIGVMMYILFSLTAASKSSDLLLPFYTNSILDLFVFEGMWVQTERIVRPIFNIQSPAQILLWVGIYSIIAIGAIATLKKGRNKLAIILVLSGLVGLLLACLSVKEFSPVYAFLYNIPGFGVMREGHKWLGLFVVMCAWSFGAAVNLILRKTIRWKVLFSVLVLFLILTLGLPMYFLSNGQIGQFEYPVNWQKLDSLARMDPKASILVLPWSGYDEYSFVDGQYIASPVQIYFANKIISSRFAHNINYYVDCDIQDITFCVDYNSPKEVWDDFIKTNEIKYILINKTVNEDNVTIKDIEDKIDYQEIYSDNYSTFVVLR